MNKKTIHPVKISHFNFPHYSTISFEKFLRREILLSKTVIDAGCGYGDQLLHFVKKYNKINFIGLDYRNVCIQKAKFFYDRLKINKNIYFKQQNIKKIKNIKCDGVMSNHTFCCFKKIEEPLNFLINLKPKWIGINSLFYDGPLDVLIHIREYTEKNYKSLEVLDDNPDGDFNIFSLEKLKKILLKHRYKIVKTKQFFPPKKLIQPKNKSRGSYTLKTKFNKNTIFSGPVYLPWHFVLIKKIDN